ncbi:hypothetical protein vseg_008217 [Gypsophila vaccaria]
MEKDKILGLPPTGRTPPPTPTPQTAASFSNDLSRMPEHPPKTAGHRRAHSEILSLPDDICFDGDIAAVDGGAPSFSDDTEEDLFSMYIDMERVSSETGDAASSEFRSKEAVAVGRSRHQHSQSMDGSLTIEAEIFGSGGGGGGGEEVERSVEAKKAMSAAKLAELALIDPKRAKRIWANRQSAARSKERKMRYIAELERKVHVYQTEATSLSAQLTLLQRDTNGLTSENSELKIRLQTMEQQVHLQDTLNDALKEEIQHLKMLTGQAMSNGGPMVNYPASFGTSQPFYPNNQTMHTLLTSQQFQQLQIRSQKQKQHQQFQHHQLHQLQQQQLQQQDPTHSTQHPADYKMKPSMSTAMDNALDSMSGTSKD